MGAVNAVATLTACLAAAIWLACHRPNRLWWRFTGMVGGLHRARGAVVGGRAGAARPGQSAVPGLHRILRRDHAVDVTDRDAARHRRVDTVRRAERHCGRLTGDGIGRRARDHTGGGRRPGGAGDAVDACPRHGSSPSCSSVSPCWPSDIPAAWDRLWPLRFRRSSTRRARRCETCTNSNRCCDCRSRWVWRICWAASRCRAAHRAMCG